MCGGWRGGGLLWGWFSIFFENFDVLLFVGRFNLVGVHVNNVDSLYDVLEFLHNLYVL